MTLNCPFAPLPCTFLVKNGKIWHDFVPSKRPEADTLANNPFICNTGFRTQVGTGWGKLRINSHINFLTFTISVTMHGPGQPSN